MEEMMTGQKVVKVFCHEDGAKEGFDKVNGEIFYNARNGNRFANVLITRDLVATSATSCT